MKNDTMMTISEVKLILDIFIERLEKEDKVGSVVHDMKDMSNDMRPPLIRDPIIGKKIALKRERGED